MYFSSTGAGTGVGGWNMIIHYDDTARVVIHYELSCSSFPTDPFRYVTPPTPPTPLYVDQQTNEQTRRRQLIHNSWSIYQNTLNFYVTNHISSSAMILLMR